MLTMLWLADINRRLKEKKCSPWDEAAKTKVVVTRIGNLRHIIGVTIGVLFAIMWLMADRVGKNQLKTESRRVIDQRFGIQKPNGYR